MKERKKKSKVNFEFEKAFTFKKPVTFGDLILNNNDLRVMREHTSLSCIANQHI